MTDDDLYGLTARAADYITAHGWTQGQMRDGAGRVCLEGALRACSPQPGDWLVARAVARSKGHGWKWNDEGARTQAEVIDWLRKSPVTDEVLAETFGPQWAEIVILIRRAATLALAQQDALVDGWCTNRLSEDAAWRVIFAAGFRWRPGLVGSGAGCPRMCSQVRGSIVAWRAIEDAAVDAKGPIVGGAVAHAALALSARDLIGGVFTQAHYDNLTRAWRTVIGPIHRDDVPMSGEPS